MPFNSQSYYRNKAKREAQEYFAAARTSIGPERQANVRLARSTWRTYLGYLRLDQCDADLKRFRRGEITYREFMDKWDIRKENENAS
jgi:hypothetical protein